MRIQVEDMTKCIDDILELTEDSYNEVSVFNQFKYNPDVVLFKTLHDADALFILTLRDGVRLCGYSVNVINRDMVTQIVKSSCISMYVIKEARGKDSIRLIKMTEDVARDLNVVMHTVASPVLNDMHALFIRRAYKQIETWYAKLL